MPNSIETKAKRICELLDHDDSMEVLGKVCDMIEDNTGCIGAESKRWLSTRTIAWMALLLAIFLPPIVSIDQIMGTANAWRAPKAHVCDAYGFTD